MKLHYRSLFNYGAKYSSDPELVKDSIQELFAGLWARRTRLSREVHPKAYLIASLRRGLHRKIQRENKLMRYQDGTDPSDWFQFELSVEEKIIGREEVQLLAKKIASLISTLPKRQKEVIYLKFFQDLSRDEIAQIMGNHPQTVSNLLQLALKKLRVDLSGIVHLLMLQIILPAWIMAYQTSLL